MEHTTRLDAWIPQPDAREIHSRTVEANPQHLYDALKHKPLQFRGPSRALMSVRFIGELLKGKSKHTAKASFVDLALRLGFVILDEEPNEELILGFVGRFWQLVPEILPIKAEDFLAFNRPGYAKAVVNFKITNIDGMRYSLSTETRVKGCDPRSTRILRCYWFLIRPFSGLIRHDTLRAIADAAREF